MAYRTNHRVGFHGRTYEPDQPIAFAEGEEFSRDQLIACGAIAEVAAVSLDRPEPAAVPPAPAASPAPAPPVPVAAPKPATPKQARAPRKPKAK